MLDIEGVLETLGITVARVEGKESWALCPLHYQRTGKMDHKPSWSINVESTAHHCFSCGYSGNIITLYRDLTGSVPDDLEWTLVKESVVSTLAREPEPAEPEGPKVSEWTLSQYTDLPDSLLRLRRLQRSSVDRYGVRWDPVGKCWVIPVRSVDGDLMGYQFRQKGQVINHPGGMEKSKTLFGVHQFLTDTTKIVVVESPLDAVRFDNIDVPAVSSFGAYVSKEQVDILARHFRYVVIAMDNDPVGIKSSFYLRKSLERRGCVVMEFDYGGLDAKDPGDVASDAELRNAWLVSNSLTLTR